MYVSHRYIYLGYNMRTHIARSLQRRCTAIQSAVKKYNAAATNLDPPHPTFDWTKGSHYSFLEEFSLLCDTRQDISQKPWAQPVFCEVMQKTQRIQHAHEEILWCNVEICRLQTWVSDEDCLFSCILEEHGHGHRDPLSGAIYDYCSRRRRVNEHILSCIAKTQALDGFTGQTSTGISIATNSPFAPTASAAATAAAAYDNDNRDISDDDELADDFDKVLGYVLTAS